MQFNGHEEDGKDDMGLNGATENLLAIGLDSPALTAMLNAADSSSSCCNMFVRGRRRSCGYELAA